MMQNMIELDVNVIDELGRKYLTYSFSSVQKSWTQYESSTAVK